jgi:hypothetical protein
MDMEVNKAHCTALIYDPGEKPAFSKPVKLISASAGVSCIYAKEKTDFVPIPPLSGFSPATNNLTNSIEPPSPYESSYYRILVLVDFD